jgi:endonuclease/exonuclease/phosphatase (EEP) superfamily protein YafD
VRADLVALLQKELAGSYPYLHAEPSRFTLGIAFLSRQPFRKIETISAGSADRMQRRYLRAELDWQGQPVTLVGIHPLPPMNGSWAASRNYEIHLMGEVARAERQPFVLLGDLNASPWSQPMRQLLAQTELRYALQGYGVGLTWRLAGVLLGAPLDYVLVSPQWKVVDYLEEGDISSDHIPIQADLVLP